MMTHDPTSGLVRVLVTGAGGPAAVSVLKSLRADQAVALAAADMDPWAAGMYLVRPAQRVLIPAGRATGFTDILLRRCIELGINVVIPTVDDELRLLGADRKRYDCAGVRLLLAPDRTLDLTLDKLALARCCRGVVPVPRTELLDDTDPGSWEYPVLVKPRTGSGSRGTSMVSSAADLAALSADEDLIVQEYLPGQEYSVDVIADRQGQVLASVPRVREKVDSGVSVAGRTIHDRDLESFGTAVAERIGLTYVANVQFRRDRAGRPALLQVNPRFPGTMPLTVAAGVDMPRIALDSLLGKEVPERIRFDEIAMVRYLDEAFVTIDEVKHVAV